MHHCQRLNLWYRRVVLNHKSCMHPFCETYIVLVLLFSYTYTMFLYFLSFPSPNDKPVEPSCPIIFISQYLNLGLSLQIAPRSPRQPTHPPPTPAPPYSIPAGEEIFVSFLRLGGCGPAFNPTDSDSGHSEHSLRHCV